MTYVKNVAKEISGKTWRNLWKSPEKEKTYPSLLGQECASVGFGKSQVSGEVLSEGGGLYKMENISYTKKGEL